MNILKGLLLRRFLLCSFFVLAIQFIAHSVTYAATGYEFKLSLPNKENPQENHGFIESIGHTIRPTSLYTNVNATSPIPIRTLPANYKIVVVDQTENYFKIQIYRNSPSYYIKKMDVQLKKVYYNEVITPVNGYTKSVYYEIEKLTNKFQDTLLQSEYAQLINATPSLQMIQANRKYDDTLYYTMLFSAVDKKGNVIPSLEPVPFQDELKTLVALIFLKLAITKPKNINLIIQQPVFNEKGLPIENKSYATLTFDMESATLSDLVTIKNNPMKLWDYISVNLANKESNNDPALVFSQYPN